MNHQDNLKFFLHTLLDDFPAGGPGAFSPLVLYSDIFIIE